MNPSFAPFVREQARALARAGHKVTVVYTPPWSWKWALRDKKIRIGTTDRTESGVREIITYHPKTHLWSLDQGARNRLGKKILSRLVQEQGLPDLVHVHTFEAGDLARWFQMRYGIPFVLTEHFTGFARGLLKPGQLKEAVRAFSGSCTNIAVSDRFRMLLEKETNCPFVTIPNMVNTDFFAPSKDDDNRKMSGTLKMISVGQLLPKKNHILLLEALRELRDNGLDYRLDIVGEGPERPRLESFIKSRKLQGAVTLCGFLPPEKLLGAYHRAELFVLPSLFETFGIVVIEAMACGLPAIVTRCGGPEEIVREGITGYVIEPELPALTKAIEKAAWKNWSKKDIRKQVMDNWSEKAVIAKIEGVYNNALGR
jgi:glycosyltransferase involved in cell wall biosynthesis